MGQPSDGYDASASGIRRRAEKAHEEAAYARALRDELAGVFAREGRPMGDDLYGAELDKSFPKRRDAILEEFHSYIAELEATHEGMRTSAKHYDTARRQSEH
ncbi:hypothetical protein GCM10010149_86460 [Nonomuraea roseoviolacea subsp. roseoviolacea]|uniref:Uncharacterized protein n=1 Tax=Nonomuraea roseoviolacea subsp. carminata TaxID=160689 RepID=A0ABT1JX12_9ACTN|nr:hypothetical protein [Nonomuraea roseoviolacea]MCP2345957.1 hypothetical protein [Nonomuraea roseoviolacea subsp. carminata]